MATVSKPMVLNTTGQRIRDALRTQYTTDTTWAACSYSTLAKAIDEADKGNLDLHNDLGWTAGDERSVSLSNGETITLVLSDPGHYSLATATSSGRKTCNFTLIMKQCSKTTQAMNSSATNTGSWESSAMKTYLNGTYLAYFPKELTSVMKDFIVTTASSYNGTSNQNSTQKLALFAAKEVFGGTASSAGLDTSYSNLTEFNALTQLDYFKNSANRIKQVNGSNFRWWLRSPFCNNATNFCYVTIGGTANNNSATGTHGVLAFGCI